MYDVGIVNMRGLPDKRIDKMLRLAAACSYEYTVAGFNELHSGVSSACFVPVFFLPIEMLCIHF
jgi:hypothetical protein